MPAIDFFIAQDERVEFIKYILDSGAELIPDLNYSEPEFEPLRSLRDILEKLSQTKLFFISREDFWTSPMEMRKIRKSGTTLFYMYPRNGGPTIQLYLGPEYEKNGIQYLAANSLSYYPWYKNTIVKENEKPSTSLIRFYKELVAFIRFRCESIKPGVRTYWICKKVESDIRAGTKLVGLENFSFHQIINSRRDKKRSH